jgi:hypothetical protein
MIRKFYSPQSGTPSSSSQVTTVCAKELRGEEGCKDVCGECRTLEERAAAEDEVKNVRTMKEKIEQMYIQALIDDLPPNVFADQVLRLFSVVGRSEQCCSPTDGFYLGTTCPHCKKPFRKDIK